MDYYDSTYYEKAKKKPYEAYYKRLCGQLGVYGDVLDLGCGFGEFLNACKARTSVMSISGVDISEKALSQCRGGKFYIGNIEDPPPFDKKFHWVSCLGVLEYVENKYQVMRNIKNMLVLDGNAVVLVPIAEFIFRQMGFEGTEQKTNREDVLPMLEWEAMFESCGFEIVERIIDTHMLTRDWILSEGRVKSVCKFFMAIILCSLPITMTYQVYFVLKPQEVSK
jgi:SAM-dependent methyltransferase